MGIIIDHFVERPHGNMALLHPCNYRCLSVRFLFLASHSCINTNESTYLSQITFLFSLPQGSRWGRGRGLCRGRGFAGSLHYFLFHFSSLSGRTHKIHKTCPCSPFVRLLKAVSLLSLHIVQSWACLCPSCLSVSCSFVDTPLNIKFDHLLIFSSRCLFFFSFVSVVMLSFHVLLSFHFFFLFSFLCVWMGVCSVCVL